MELQIQPLEILEIICKTFTTKLTSTLLKLYTISWPYRDLAWIIKTPRRGITVIVNIWNVGLPSSGHLWVNMHCTYTYNIYIYMYIYIYVHIYIHTHTHRISIHDSSPYSPSSTLKVKQYFGHITVCKSVLVYICQGKWIFYDVCAYTHSME